MHALYAHIYTYYTYVYIYMYMFKMPAFVNTPI